MEPLFVVSEEQTKHARHAEAVFTFRTWEKFPDVKLLVQEAELKLRNGPIWASLDGACCKELEGMCMTNSKALFQGRGAATSIMIKRTPLVLGGDVRTASGAKKKLSPVQGIEEWKVAAKTLLDGQNALVKHHVGSGWVIPAQFDFGSQVLMAMKKGRQKGHGDSITSFIAVVTFLTEGASKTSFADLANFNVGAWQDKMLLQMGRLPSADADTAISDLVTELREFLEQQDSSIVATEAAKQGETCIFNARDIHWGNASDSKHARYVVYSEAIPELVFHAFLDQLLRGVSLRSTLLTTYYTAEYVVDRRTIASPSYLHNLWLYKADAVLKSSVEDIALTSDSVWEYISRMADAQVTWPRPVCHMCADNHGEVVVCAKKDCWMGAIHKKCIPGTRVPWKCPSCLAGQ